MIQIKSRFCTVAGLLLTLVVLASCGGSAGGGQEAAGGERSEAQQQTVRTVEHAHGSTEVPAEPERVVILIGDAGVDALLTLGVVPVGATSAEAETMPLWYEEAEFPVEVAPGDIEHLGEAGEPSIEKIAALNPDLIVGWDYQVEETYDQLSEIAPTVGVSPTNGPEWKESFRGVAEAVGREEEYKEYLQSYDERLRELRSELEGEPSDYTATVLWNFDDSAIWLYGEPSQPGSIVLDAGFRMPEIARIYDEISTERFPEVDADAIFVMAGEERIPRRREDFEPTFGDNALWRRLDAVENGRVYPVEIYLWTNGGPAGIRDVMLPQMFAAFEG